MKDFCKGCGWSKTKTWLPYCVKVLASSATSCDRFYEFPHNEENKIVEEKPTCGCSIDVIVNKGCPSTNGGKCPSLKND